MIHEKYGSIESKNQKQNVLIVNARVNPLYTLNPTNFECLRWPSGVHSVNSIARPSPV